MDAPTGNPAAVASNGVATPSGIAAAAGGSPGQPAADQVNV